MSVIDTCRPNRQYDLRVSEKSQDILYKDSCEIKVGEEIEKVKKRIQENGILKCASYNTKDRNVGLACVDINGNERIEKIPINNLCDIPSVITLSSEDYCGTCDKIATGVSNKVWRTDTVDCCSVKNTTNPMVFKGTVESIKELHDETKAHFDGEVCYVIDVRKSYVYNNGEWICLESEPLQLDPICIEKTESQISRFKRKLCKSLNTYYSSVYNKKKRNLVRV